VPKHLVQKVFFLSHTLCFLLNVVWARARRCEKLCPLVYSCMFHSDLVYGIVDGKLFYHILIKSKKNNSFGIF